MLRWMEGFERHGWRNFAILSLALVLLAFSAGSFYQNIRVEYLKIWEKSAQATVLSFRVIDFRDPAEPLAGPAEIAMVVSFSGEWGVSQKALVVGHNKHSFEDLSPGSPVAIVYSSSNPEAAWLRFDPELSSPLRSFALTVLSLCLIAILVRSIRKDMPPRVELQSDQRTLNH